MSFNTDYKLGNPWIANQSGMAPSQETKNIEHKMKELIIAIFGPIAQETWSIERFIERPLPQLTEGVSELVRSTVEAINKLSKAVNNKDG